MIATILRILVAAGLIGLMLSRIPARDVLAAIRSTNEAEIAAAFLLALLAECIVAYRLVVIARAHELVVSTREAVAINLSTRFYALALPGGSAVGTALRIHRLVRGSARYVDVVVSVLLDRLSTTAVMCTLGAIFWIVDPVAKEWPAGLVLTIAALAVTALYALLVWRGSLPRVLGFVEWIERRLPQKLSDIRQLAHATRAPVILTARTWAISLIVHGVATWAVWLITRAMGVNVSWIALVWIRAAALLAAALPISIAGLGLREGVFAVLLGTYGVAASQALAFSVLVFAVTVLGVALVGALFEVRRVLLEGSRG